MYLKQANNHQKRSTFLTLLRLFRFTLCSLTLTLPPLNAATNTPSTPPEQEKTEPSIKDLVRIVPVDKTPEAEAIELRIIAPKQGEIESPNLFVQFNLYGYPIGTNSQFPRAKEVKNAPYGQSIHVVIDNHLYVPVANPSVDVFDEDGNFRQAVYRAKIPFPLEPGPHVIRAFLCRSYGESLRGKGCFDARSFFVKRRTDDPLFNLQQPLLTYNEPAGTFSEGKPILLDFYVSNVKLSKDGYTVKLSIDGEFISFLYEWRPYYIYGLTKGEHEIHIELYDEKNRPVAGDLNHVKHTIYVK